jgi:hypothetical protein
MGKCIFCVFIIHDINDNKVSFSMEVLKNFSFVKNAIPITNAKFNLMQVIKEAVEEIILVREGN